VKPTGTGFLAINSVPWGKVYVDGQEVAPYTPVYRLATPAGRHEVRIFNPKSGYSPSQHVLLKVGQVRVLGFRW
jgi:hypothetical protein